jgi:hypothetical protein
MRAVNMENSMHRLRLIQKYTQSRFLILLKLGGGVSKVGIALQWQCGIIVGIVIMKDADEEMFLHGDTEINIDYSSGQPELLGLGQTLAPPYLIPKPPYSPPTVFVTVLSCQHLKSRLKRVVKRHVNPFVVVQVDGVRKQTEVKTNTANPIFNKTSIHLNPFVFPFRVGGEVYVEFQVEDRKALDSDRLATVRVPLPLVECAMDTEAPPKLFSIPLVIGRRHFGVSERIGRVRKDSTASVLLPSDILEAAEGNEEAPPDSSESVPYLHVLISKSDVGQWWMLQELKARDELREKTLLAEELARQEKQKQKQREREQQAKERGSAPQGRDAAHAVASVTAGAAGGGKERMIDRVYWIDSDIVKKCGG